MDNILVFDDKTKIKMGVICFVPAICFFLTLLYYIYLLLPLTVGHIEPAQVVGITSQNYDTLFTMAAFSAVVSAAVLIYCIVTLARVRNMNAQSKMIWVLALAAFVPLSSIFFWVLVIKREPKYVPRYPDIA